MSGFPDRIKHSSGHWMTLENNRLVASFRDAKSAGAKSLGKLKLVPETVGHPGATKEEGRARVRLNNTAARQWMRTADGSPVDWDRVHDLQRDKESPLLWAAPVYRIVIDGREDFLTMRPDAVLVQAHPRVKDKELAGLLKEHGLKIDEKRSKYLGGFRYCRLSEPTGGAVFDLMEKLGAKSDLVMDVRFETVPMFVPTAFVPNDPLFGDQWDMVQINAGGPGQTGWNIERGVAGVIICVLDEGCDLTHPDLTCSPGINLGTMSGDGSPTGNHGTACAGIAAGSTHNNEGVAGVAGGCTILPAAVDSWSDVEIAAGIRYATDEGARVISMSFGWNPWDHAVIDPAIQYAFDADVVMCVATHNHNSTITYPATHPLVMACGASDQIDNRKTPASPDGEGWGSNFGPEISVVAPGVLCPSTDRQGNVGYNTAAGAAGNYVMDFNGTSSATPHVAGLAALLLSVDDSLTNVEIRAIIESTTDKVGTVAYAAEPGYPNGTWNEEMGYGRINVLAALNVIRKRCELDFKALFLEEKFRFPEDFKLRRFKEKESIDEVKGLIGYENPEVFDPSIYETILVRLERLEQMINKGRPFIQGGQRPDVGRGLARQVAVKKGESG